MAEIYNKLKNATYALFPKTGAWSSDKFKKGDDSLQAHLRDSLWLTRELKKYLNDVDEDTIRVFVESSQFFKEMRENYEQLVVKWQIEWMVSGGENWLVSDEYGGDFIEFDPLCDIGFRKGILDTLLAIGMNEEAIEEGIEKNAGLWRDAYMKKAFRNKYEPIDLFTRKSDEPFIPTTEEHLEKWLRLRRHQYYQVHKKSVDAYGIYKNGMNIGDEEELRKLSEELAKLDMERMAYLKYYNENSKIVPFSLDLFHEPTEEVKPQSMQQEIPEAQPPQKGVKSLIKKLFPTKK